MGRTFASLVTLGGAVGLFVIAFAPAGKVLSSFAPDLHAKHRGCSIDTLEGDYVWRFNRVNVASGAHRDALGVMSFDGAGNVSAIVTFNDDGVSTLRVPRAGTYTVDADCTGTLLLDSVNYWDLVLTDDAREGRVIQTAPPGNRATGVLRRR
ncbi:MAG TPA: hypothetical protein VGY48_26645 [Vicinamibacterales bacterium]|jgi:hypothetical protein|nr:hypothetical protein [Vicinamibacterales bacterium]